MSIQHAHALSDCGTETPNADASTICTTEIHSILSNKRRLFLLEELIAREEAEFNDLVDAVAQRELGITPENPDWHDERKKVRVSLYQTHIDRLKEHGIIDYQRKTGLIQLAENAEAISPYLEVPTLGTTEDSCGILDRVSSAFRSMCD